LFDSVTGGSQHALVLLLAAIGFLLLIASSNVSSLAIARASSRIREMGVRAALGAEPSRLLRQLLTESLLLGIAKNALKACLAFGSIRLLLRLDPGNIPRLEKASINMRILFFALGVSVLTSALFKLFPAFSASRCDPNEVL